MKKEIRRVDRALLCNAHRMGSTPPSHGSLLSSWCTPYTPQTIPSNGQSTIATRISTARSGMNHGQKGGFNIPNPELHCVQLRTQ